jgi:hypothetical protein
MIAAALVLSLAAGQLTPEQLGRVNQDRNDANRAGMMVLNTWAAGNITEGLAGWISAEDPEWRAFHQMNFLWNLVNLGLGVNGVIQTWVSPASMDLAGARQASMDTQISYLVNFGLDFVYLAAAAILVGIGVKHDVPLLRGWGKSILIQAVFLAVFDLALFFMNNSLGAPLRAGTQNVL